MSNTSNQLDYEFVDDVSSRGASIKYIHFIDDNFRLNTEQKSDLKKICNGYFFYSKIKKMWGFTVKGQNELNVSNFLKTGAKPNIIENKDFSLNIEYTREQLPFVVGNFKFNFFEMSGRPLFYIENTKNSIQININLKHWFFVEKNEIEKEFAKKIILSLVGTKLEFTSLTIDSFFSKLDSIQTNLKYEYASNQ